MTAENAGPHDAGTHDAGTHDVGRATYELAPGLEHISSHFAVESWDVLAESPGYVKVRVPLLPRLKNRRSQLFGGYTAAYVDLLAFRVARSGGSHEPGAFFATTSMRIDYLEAVIGDSFEAECQLLKSRGKNAITEARFSQGGVLAVFAVTTLLALPWSAPES